MFGEQVCARRRSGLVAAQEPLPLYADTMLVQEEMLQDLALGLDKLYKKARSYAFYFIYVYCPLYFIIL